MSMKALQDYTFVSKSARYLPEKKRRETWSEAVERVRNMHLGKYPQITEEINWAFEQVRQKRVLGSQRALQYGGSPIEKKHCRIYNCSATYCDRLRSFQECFWVLLCGCGVGLSVQKHHIAKLPPLSAARLSGKSKKLPNSIYVIPDSIEGWADSLGVLLSSYFDEPIFEKYYNTNVNFDYSQIRPEGSLLSSGCGKAPGHKPLEIALENIRKLLDQAIIEREFRPIHAYDTIMHASDAVLSGGIRRSATIILFSPDDEEMAMAKTGNWFIENPQRGRSNNSALLIRNKTSKEDFVKLMKSVKEFGEPGFVFSDSAELIVNPCCEISMYPVDIETGKTGFQFCNLCEINGKKCKTEEDFMVAAEAAAIIGTCQAGYTAMKYLGETTEKILKREALLGVSITGMMDSPDILFNPEIQRKVAKYILKVNEEIAEKIGINPCARATCVKPAGCQNPNTMIVSDQGILSLWELDNVSGEKWQNHNINVFSGFENKTSTKLFVNGWAETFKIKMQSGVVLECTSNHKYQILRNGKLNWVKAEEILVGDLMPYAVGGYSGGQNIRLKDLPDIHPNSNWNKSPEYYDLELCWLIGLYTGDGSNHKKGIRIHGNSNDSSDLEMAQKIITSHFGLKSKIEPDRRGNNRITLVVNSVDLVKWLQLNDLSKSKSLSIIIPEPIRRLSPALIKSFIDGYWSADGSTHENNKTRSWVTTSYLMAQQLVTVLRAIGQDCAVREMPPTETSKGKNMRYWIQERKGRTGNIKKSPLRYAYTLLDQANLQNLTPDFVVEIQNSECMTYDIEVPDGNCYVANSYLSHNTTSCLLATSSGIHPHHANRYIRRSQGNHLEPPLQYFKSINPLAVEKSVWATNKTDEVISFCVEVPKGAKTKNDVDALTLLEYVKLTQNNWVAAGANKERCTQDWLMHNVSNTITVRPDEWDAITDYIYENRSSFTGISLLPITGDKDYPQAPFTAIYTPKEIQQMYGEGSMFASGLIVDGLHAFDDNLWKACNTLLGFEELKKPEFKEADNDEDYDDDEKGLKLALYRKAFELESKKFEAQTDWIRRAKQFADRYFDGDIKNMTYCLKDVNNLHYWNALKREYKEVDYTLMIEEQNNVEFTQELACSGGACSVSYA